MQKKNYLLIDLAAREGPMCWLMTKNCLSLHFFKYFVCTYSTLAFVWAVFTLITNTHARDSDSTLITPVLLRLSLVWVSTFDH